MVQHGLSLRFVTCLSSTWSVADAAKAESLAVTIWKTFILTNIGAIGCAQTRSIEQLATRFTHACLGRDRTHP